MNHDTLRYLLSALIQVFGALVAVDAMFLIFQHQYLVSRRAPLLLELARYVITLVKLREPYDTLASPRERDIVERGVARLVIQTPKDISAAIAEAHDFMEKEIEKWDHGLTHGHEDTWDESAARNNLAHLRNHKPQFEYVMREYASIQDRLTALPILVAKSMGLPAFLVVLFSFALCWVGKMTESQNLMVAGPTIVISALGLYFLIRQAYEVVKD